MTTVMITLVISAIEKPDCHFLRQVGVLRLRVLPGMFRCFTSTGIFFKISFKI